MGPCRRRTLATAASTSGMAPKDVAVTYDSVRVSRPSGSWWYRECSKTPAATSGWAAWSNKARMAPTKTEVSPTMVHVAEPGPNKPGSPR